MVFLYGTLKAKDVDLLLLFPVVLPFFFWKCTLPSAYVSASLFVDSKYQMLH